MEFINGKDDIPYMTWKTKINVWNHQPAIFGWFWVTWLIKNNIFMIPKNTSWNCLWLTATTFLSRGWLALDTPLTHAPP